MARGDEVCAPGVEPGNWVEVEMAEEDAEGVVRVDTGVREGGEISIHYDPMISKLIVHGPGRRLQRVLRATRAAWKLARWLPELAPGRSKDELSCSRRTLRRDREHARRLMSAALDRYLIGGVRHNLNFLRTLMHNERFAAGDLTTAFIPEEFPDGYEGHQLSEVSSASPRPRPDRAPTSPQVEREDLLAAAAAMKFQQAR